MYCHCYLLIAFSFGASGRLCFVIVSFPAYLHFIFWVDYDLTVYCIGIYNI